MGDKFDRIFKFLDRHPDKMKAALAKAIQRPIGNLTHAELFAPPALPRIEGFLNLPAFTLNTFHARPTWENTLFEFEGDVDFEDTDWTIQGSLMKGTTVGSFITGYDTDLVSVGVGSFYYDKEFNLGAIPTMSTKPIETVEEVADAPPPTEPLALAA